MRSTLPWTCSTPGDLSHARSRGHAARSPSDRLCTIFAARSTPAISGEPQTGVTLEDYLGCWTSLEPAGLTIETDYNKPDGYIVLVESMMLSIERVNSKPEFRDLVKGAFDIWPDDAGTLIPTQYYNGVFDPVARSVTQGAPG
jgi:hypothetical protein